MRLTNKEFNHVLDIGIELSTAKNSDLLLSRMIHAGMNITKCDAGTLYLYEADALHFRVMITKSMGVCRGENGEAIDLPPVAMSETNVCACAALHRESINIADVYNSEGFDFSGPKRYDNMTGYHTQSMLVVPLLNNEDELLGVLQLINAMDDAGNIISFDPEYETIVQTLGSMAAIKLSNLAYLKALKLQQYSFVEAMTTAIDERTPYNGAHSRKVAEYSGMLADYIEKLHQRGKEEDSFPEERKEKLMLAALLHDIGKMIVPLSVMNRSTRLEQEIDRIKDRFKLLQAYCKIDWLTGKINEEEYQRAKALLDEEIAFIEEVNNKGFLDDDTLGRVQEIAAKKYVGEGIEIPYLTEEEIIRLSVRKGTLTNEDRIQMENHVVMTEKILSHVRFNKPDAIVVKWASEHHELLDGSGYPRHLSGDALCLETRILAVADVYDALTASDRPYKKPIPMDRALDILRSMVNEGKLEGRLVEYLAAALQEA